MTSDDVYQRLFQRYAPFKVHMVEDSMMDVLRLQFTPEEAELAIKVGFRGKKLDEIQSKTGMEKAALKRMLTTMAHKGTMWVTPGVEDPDYKTIGVGGPGLIETGGWGNIRFPHSVRLMKALHKFQMDLAAKWLPSLGFPATRVWTTPAALPKDAKPEENVAEVMKRAGCWGVSTCSCRLPHWVADPGNHCTQELETCLFMGEMARWGYENGMCRLITYEEAMEIVRRSNQDGLVHTHDPGEFLCNCCVDCCVFLVSRQLTGAIPLQLSEFVAKVDEATCSACSTCADRCPVAAVDIGDYASINADKCLGCGVCFPTCPTTSIEFVRRPAASPCEREDRHGHA
jgi:electron transport complex protein RnfB